MPRNTKKHCNTWYLLNWLRRQKQEQTAQSPFARGAQAALDTANTAPSPAVPSRGTMYRKGLTLAELEPGECGDVRRLIGSTQGRLRLLELGLTPGTHVKLLRAAAFGGPLDIL